MEGSGMAKKITLTVNETLFSKIDQWRSSFNLSKLFQEAVSEAIKAKEEFYRRLSGEEDLPQIVERLKSEKRVWLEKAHAEGEADGTAWAGRAHYKDLVATLALMAGGTLDGAAGYSLPAAEDQCVEAWQKKGQLPGTGSPGLGEVEQVYREGWRDGVRGLWEIVKDQLDD